MPHGLLSSCRTPSWKGSRPSLPGAGMLLTLKKQSFLLHTQLYFSVRLSWTIPSTNGNNPLRFPPEHFFGKPQSTAAYMLVPAAEDGHTTAAKLKVTAMWWERTGRIMRYQVSTYLPRRPRNCYSVHKQNLQTYIYFTRLCMYNIKKKQIYRSLRGKRK